MHNRHYSVYWLEIFQSQAPNPPSQPDNPSNIKSGQSSKYKTGMDNRTIPVQESHPRVFISAKSEDFVYAKKIFNFLIDEGINTFFSEESLPALGNSDYRQQIEKVLDAADHLIIVGSSAANINSNWIQYELGIFLNEKLPGRKNGNVITITVGDVPIEQLPTGLRSFEVIPYNPDNFGILLKYLT